MTFESSLDGVTFTPLAEIKTDLDPREMTPTIRDYRVKVPSIKTRYIRLHIYNFGKIPSWHPGAGFDAFIFIDEVFLN